MNTLAEAWKRPTTASDVAEWSTDAESFGRNLRDWQHSLRRLTSQPEFARRIGETPPLMRERFDDSGQSDAYLAAYVEWLCHRHGVAVPEWVEAPERAASRAWYDYPPLWPSSFVLAPGPFRRRGVFTMPEDVLGFRRGRPPVSDAEKRRNNAERQRRHRRKVQEKLRRTT